MSTDSTSISRKVPRLGLNRAEVALAIGVSANTVDVMVAEGFLPKPKVWHTRKVWLVSEIEASMSEWPEEGVPVGKGEDVDAGDSWRASV